jgi:hypothetical protein
MSMVNGTESDLPSGLSKPALRALHGMGPKGLDEIRRALTEKGLSFASES